MKKDDAFTVVAKVRKDFLQYFKAPNYTNIFQTIDDLMWQILINNKYGGKTLAFTVTIEQIGLSEHYGNELVLADNAGGYFKTGVFFENDNLNECYPIATQINEMAFGLTEDDANKVVSKSMHAVR